MSSFSPTPAVSPPSGPAQRLFRGDAGKQTNRLLFIVMLSIALGVVSQCFAQSFYMTKTAEWTQINAAPMFTEANSGPAIFTCEVSQWAVESTVRTPFSTSVPSLPFEVTISGVERRTFSRNYSNLAAMNAAFPDGASFGFNTNSSYHGTLSGSFLGPRSAQRQVPPVFFTNYAQLQNVVPEQLNTVRWSAWTRDPIWQGEGPRLRFRLLEGPYKVEKVNVLYEDIQPGSEPKEYTFPPGTLKPAKLYNIEVSIESRSRTHLSEPYPEIYRKVWSANTGYLSTTKMEFRTKGPQPVMSLRRLNDISEVSNPDGWVDEPLLPRAHAATLSTLPAVTKGMVADGVTPLVVKVDLGQPGEFDPIELNFTEWQYGEVAKIADRALVFDPRFPEANAWQLGKTTPGGPIRVPIDPTTGVGYALLQGVKSEDLQFDDSGPVAMGRLRASSVSASSECDVQFTKPPVVLVHGTHAKSETWTQSFRAAFAERGIPVFAVDWGQADNGTVTRPFEDLAGELSAELSKIVEAPATATVLPRSEWAMTRYDVVGHSQGGLLLRMLCTNNTDQTSPPLSTYYDGQLPWKNTKNFNRGRFRRVVTVAASHNGLIISKWLNSVSSYLYGTSLPQVIRTKGLGSVELLIPKFDPWGAEMKLVNHGAFSVDEDARFHFVSTQIDGGDIPSPAIPAYGLSGLWRTGTLLLPNGSDGVAEPESAQAGRFAKFQTDPAVTHWSSGDIPHSAPVFFFKNKLRPIGLPDTENPELGGHIAKLLEGSEDRFASYVPPAPRSEGQRIALEALALIDFAPHDWLYFAPNAIVTAIQSDGPNLPGPPMEINSYHYMLTNLPEEPAEGTIRWSAAVYGTNGVSEEGVTVTQQAADPKKVEVSLAPGLVGDIVLIAHFMTVSERLVVAGPLVVNSSPPAGAVQTGIEIRGLPGGLTPGAKIEPEIWRTYDDGTALLAYVPSGGVSIYSSSDPAILDIEDQRIVAALAAGSGTITVSLDGFQTEKFVSVVAPTPTGPLPVPDAASAYLNPVIIPVMANDDAQGFAPLVLTGVSEPAHGTAVIDGDTVTYTPGATFHPGTGDSFRYSVTNSNGISRAAVVTVHNANTPPTLTVPVSPLVIEATGPGGAVVNFDALALDAEDGPLSLTVSRASGSQFPMGQTVVSCSATDTVGKTSNATFSVQVVDTAGPVISVSGSNPETIAVGDIYNDAGATAVDAVQGNVAVNAAGSVDINAIGVYQVNYSASDALGHQANVTRIVNVVAGSGPGTLDLSFSGTGRMIGSFGGDNSYGEAVAVQPDGKILVAGYTEVANHSNFTIARYHSRGVLDRSFNETGVVNTDFGGLSDKAHAIATQPDGKILVAGSSGNSGWTSPGIENFSLARYSSNGSLDLSFNGIGKVVTDFSNGFDEIRGIALQNDGKIVVAGSSNDGGNNSDFAIARYHANGTVDNSFNGTGRVTVSISNRDYGEGIAIQEDGKIVVVGWSYISTTNDDMAVVRLNADGTLDANFNGTGKVVVDFANAPDRAYDLAVQTDGKILLAGFSFTNSDFGNFAMLRLLEDGGLDASFNGTGKVTTSIGNNSDSHSGNGVSLQEDGKILVAGYYWNSSNSGDFALLRYLPDGTLDPAFHGSGKVSTGVGSGYDTANDVAVLDDGRIVVAGSSFDGTRMQFALARYHGIDGVLAPDIALEQPAGSDLQDGTGKSIFGIVSPGNHEDLVFTIVNSGTADLNDFSFSFDGESPESFNVVTTPAQTLAIGTDSTFSVRFAPASLGLKAAVMHVASNTPGSRNPFEIRLEGGDGFPSLALPTTSIIVEATGAGGAIAQFAVTGNDPEDGSLTPLVTPPSGSLFGLGTTVVTCRATDSRGKVATASFPVTVQDTTPPQLTLAGLNPIEIRTGERYVEPGATAIDVVSGNRTVAIAGLVNTDVAGSYLLTYLSSDAAGNSTSATRTVNVLPALGPGSLDPAFGGTGKVLTSFGADDFGNAVVLQADEKIVVAGYTGVGSSEDIAVLRYNADGTLDPGFGSSGVAKTSVGSGSDEGLAVAVQLDGKIVAAGLTFNGSNNDFVVIRYNATGTLDTTFNGTGKVVTAVSTGLEAANAVAVQSDGKIVVAGMSGGHLTAIRYNSNGSLDTSFNGTGKVTTILGTSSRGMSLAIQSDGKIVVAGYSQVSGNDDFALVRYTTTGGLDTTFNTTGKVTTAIGSGNDQANGVVIQTNGRIVLAGLAFNGANNDVAVVRYNINGSLDTSFNGTGKVTTAIGTSNEQANGVVLRTDERIVVTGFASNGSNNDMALVSFNSNGTLDTSLNGTGKVVTALGTGNEQGNALVTRSDGRVIVAGSYHDGTNYDIALVAYNLNGSLDNTFNGSGRSITGLANAIDTGTCIVVQADNKILVGGTSNSGQNPDFAMVRYLPDGALDMSFNGIGKVSTNIARDTCQSMALQADGKIVLAGSSESTKSNFAVFRYESNGSLDTSFNGTGKVTTAFGTSIDSGNDIAIQVDQKIIVVGSTRVGNSDDIALARYNPNGSLDTSFGTSGKVITPIGPGDDSGRGVALQPDGRIVVVGRSHNGTRYEMAVVRYSADGTLDTSFNGSGKITISFGGNYHEAKSVAILSDGKILVAGTVNPVSYSDFALVRLNADGSMDTSFGLAGKVTADISANNDTVSGMAVQSDGKIVLCGFSYINGTDFAVMRFNSNGVPDKDFNGTGKITTDVNNLYNQAMDVALQTDGTIVVAGYVYENPNRDSDFAVFRYRGGSSPQEIAIEFPAGVNLQSGVSVIAATPVAPGASSSFELVVRNTGGTALTGMSATVDGPDSTHFILTPPAVASLAAGASTTLTIQFLPTIAGNKTAILHIWSNDVNESPFDVSLTGMTLTPAESWRLQHFGTTQNTGNAADLADPNSNGIVNLVEYALGSNPNGNQYPQSMLPKLALAENGRLTLTLARYLDRNDLTLTIQVSDSLAGPWVDLARSTNGGPFSILAAGWAVAEAGTGNTRTVTVTEVPAETAQTKRFMRLGVVR